MSNKTSLSPLISDHFDTLRDGRSGRPKATDYVVQFGLPAVAGVATWSFGVRLTDLGGALGGLSIFTALLFGLQVFVFQLRLQAASDPRIGSVRAGKLVLETIDELFANVGYAVIVGLVATAAGIAAAATSSSDTGSAPWVSAILAALVLHLVLVVAMCLKRSRAAYQAMTKE